MALQTSTFWRRWLPVLLLLVVVLVLTAFNRVGQPLRVASGNGPWGLDDGMLALQFQLIGLALCYSLAGLVTWCFAR